MWESKQGVEEWVADAEELELLITEEEQMWERQGFHFGMVEPNWYLIQVKLNVIITFLQDEFGVTDEEFMARLKGEILKQMKHDRGMLIEHKMKEKRPDMTVVKSKILGPGGMPI